MMVDVGSEKGTIDHEEKEFIQNVFEFDDLAAADIVTHRTEVDFLWMEESMEEWAGTIHSTRHTLYPICADSPDQVIGVLNAKDYFRLDDKSREKVMELAVKQPYFVPGSIKADVLFRNMKRSRVSMAIALDEYGGMIGIVTLNDLIEQLVGSFDEDETNPGQTVPPIQQTADGQWIIRDNVPLEELAQAMGIIIDTEDYDTVTGLVFHELGYVPDEGECSIEHDTPFFHIEIRKIEEHQIVEAIIHALPAPSEEDSPAL
jgi:putative hemolysin